MLFLRRSTQGAAQPLVDAFLDAKRAKGLSPRTIENYASMLGIFAKALPSLPLRPGPIERFLLGRVGEPETRDTYYRAIRGLYRWLAVRREIRTNPVDLVEQPVVPKKIPRGLTDQELAALLNSEQPYKVRAYLLFLIDTGIRLAEALSVTSPAAMRDATVIVNGKTGEREVPISPLVRVAVLNALPWSWTRASSASHAMRNAFARAGITGKRASAQTLRHTFARAWEGDETILQGILGHSSPRMIRQVYRPYDVRRAIKQHGRNSPLLRF